MSGIPIGDRYRALREGADAAAVDVVAELKRRHGEHDSSYRLEPEGAGQ